MASENLNGVLKQELQQIEQRIQEFSSKKQAIENLLKAYAGNASGIHLVPHPTQSMNTLEMAREVLRKRGSEMKPEELRQAIRAQFGQEPAPTLAQMLYTRARNKKMFYRNAGGRFGLIEWQARGKRAQKKAA